MGFAAPYSELTHEHRYGATHHVRGPFAKDSAGNIGGVGSGGAASAPPTASMSDTTPKKDGGAAAAAGVASRIGGSPVDASDLATATLVGGTPLGVSPQQHPTPRGKDSKDLRSVRTKTFQDEQQAPRAQQEKQRNTGPMRLKQS